MRMPSFCQRDEPEATRDVNLLDPMIWDGVSDNSQREMLRQAETLVSATVTVALGTDSRITTAMSVLGAGGIALLAISASLVEKSSEWFLIFAPAAGAAGLLFAAVFCSLAIAPTNFLLPGVSPKSLFSANSVDEELLLDAEGRRLRAALIYSAQRAISHNMNRAIRSAHRFVLSLIIAAIGIIAGVGFLISWMANRYPVSF
jgi:hypothetical protein